MDYYASYKNSKDPSLLRKELTKQNLIGKEGTIIDATIVEAPIQHNSKEENEQIKHRLFSAAKITRLKNTSSLRKRKRRSLKCVLIAH